jgi:hypothetical protein
MAGGSLFRNAEHSGGASRQQSDDRDGPIERTDDSRI